MSPRTSKTGPFKSLWKLGGLTVAQLRRGVFVSIIANNVLGRAAELAYYSLFALFPLILIMMTLFGMFTAQSSELQNNLLSYFAGFLPPEAFQLLRKVAVELASHATGWKLIFGIVSALWCVSGAIDAMISSLNSAYHVTEDRSWLKVRAIAFGLDTLISILLLSVMFMVLAGRHSMELLGTGKQLHPIRLLAWNILRWPAIILFVVISCSLIHYCGPGIKECQRGVWLSPGSAFGVLVWLAGSFVFRIYMHFFDSYSASYGSIGAVMILLAWLYVVALAYLTGVEINAQIDRAEKANGLRKPSAVAPGS
ncbi:MAG TPA: YihY/virulence factor BrkB family protein [Edaphobacter sp.]